MLCEIQIFLNSSWKRLAQFTPFMDRIPLGYAGCDGHLEYDEEYVIDHFQSGSSLPPVSLPIPVGFIIDKYDRWPAFLLDLLPTGAGRKAWLDRLALRDNPYADWQLLTHGAQHPVGWLRITGEDAGPEPFRGQGFTRQEVAWREQGFLEYALSLGASVAGSSDVQGESPKLLLTEDNAGLFHADGALPDADAHCHWLVKFTRGRDERERRILRNEGNYLMCAALLGANVHRAEAVVLEESVALFLPRFDRACHNGRVERFGLESFASAAGIAEFGIKSTHQEHCGLIQRFSSSVDEDLLEYLRRDVLNVCLGNTDNHPRNHAFLKKYSGEVRLSPLFDVSPMFLSPEGIARVCRWGEGLERLGQPDWSGVGRYVAGLLGDAGPERIRSLFCDLSERLSRFALLADEAGIEPEVAALRRRVIDENCRLLDHGAREVCYEHS